MLDDEIKIIGLVFAILFGLLFGSFATMASHRIPNGDDIIYKSSHCVNCNHSLGFLDLFPVFSWLFNKGKCRYCSSGVSIRYPLIEIIMGGLFGLVFLKFGVSSAGIILSGLIVCLVIVCVCDIERHVIPNLVQIWMVILGVAFSHFVKNHNVLDVVVPSFLGITVGLMIKYIFALLFKKKTFRNDYVKFLGISGLFLGFEAFIIFLICSAMIIITSYLMPKKGEIVLPVLLCLALFFSIFPSYILFL